MGEKVLCGQSGSSQFEKKELTKKSLKNGKIHCNSALKLIP